MLRDYRRVEGQPDYIISNIGECWSIWFGKVKLMKQLPDKDGYLTVGLYKNGKQTTIKIHILVGIHFVGIRTGSLTYDHMDTNKINNRADNIRLATKSEQTHNQKVRKDNKLGLKNICVQVNKCGTEYYKIDIKRNGKKTRKHFRKDKYSLEQVVAERDKMLESLASLDVADMT